MNCRHYGTCPACHEKTKLERHHICPRRFYGKGKHNDHIVLLCTDCHRDIESLIPQERKMPTCWYFGIVARFIMEKSHVRTTGV